MAKKTMEYVLEINRAISGLENLEIKHDPLFDEDKMANASFIDSARKRHGLIIEAAFRDAFVERGFDCRKYVATDIGIEIDAVIISPEKNLVLGVDVKRGTSFHDSGKKRSMEQDAPRAKAALDKLAESYHLSGATVYFGYYHHYSQSNRSHVEPITALEIEYLTGVDVRRMITIATENYKDRLNDYTKEQI